MHAVILAAGAGSRMGRLTRRRPKALLPLAGRRLLDWQRAALAAAGVDRLSVVSGHAAEALPACAGLHIVHNEKWQRSGPVASFACARPQQFDSSLLVYGDGVFHPDLPRALRHSAADIAITVDCRWHELWSLRFADVLADAESLRRQGGRLVEIGRRAVDATAIQAQFTGLVRFSRAGWRQALAALDSLTSAERERIDTTSLLALLLARGVAIEAIDVAGRWCEVDSARDLALYRLLARRSPGWSHDWRWNETGA